MIFRLIAGGTVSVVVKAVAGKDHRYSNNWSGPAVVQGQVVQAIKSSQNSDNQNDDHIEIEAVMGSTLLHRNLLARLMLSWLRPIVSTFAGFELFLSGGGLTP